jgi:peptide deformylase
MAIMKILQFPDPRLREQAQPVAEVDDDVRRLIDDMFETMYDAPGVGLAATQVGIARQVAVMDVSEEKNERRVMINPEILWQEEEQEVQEGCLSVPGQYEQVKRFARCQVRALDGEGEPYELEAEDLLAQCIQHEVAHLNGCLYVDMLSELKRGRIRKKILKEQRAASQK